MSRQSPCGAGKDANVAKKARRAAYLRRQLQTPPTVAVTNVTPTTAQREAEIAAQFGDGHFAQIEAIIRASAAS